MTRIMNKVKSTQQSIVSDFGSPLIQQRYINNVSRGLRESEKIMIEKYIPSGSAILDVGCGTGRTTIALNELGYKMAGVDLTPEMIANATLIANNRGLDMPYTIEDATDFSMSDSSIDNILFLTNGWTQIPSEEKRFKALSEIYRVLKKNGIFILIFHARHERDTSFFWINQWIKHAILKNLGANIKEIDFGDLFFKRELDNNTKDKKQFMHIADGLKVKQKISSLGFEILFYGREDSIVSENLHDNDNVYNYAPMFVVCKKNAT